MSRLWLKEPWGVFGIPDLALLEAAWEGTCISQAHALQAWGVGPQQMSGFGSQGLEPDAENEACNSFPH